MPSIVRSFLGFDHLIGSALVKLVYYFGLVMIGLGIAGVFFAGLMGAFTGNISGIGQMIAGPVIGLVLLVYWRFLCELFVMAFLAFERLTEVRDLMRIAAGQAAPSEPDPNHPEF